MLEAVPQTLILFQNYTISIWLAHSKGRNSFIKESPESKLYNMCACVIISIGSRVFVHFSWYHVNKENQKELVFYRDCRVSSLSRKTTEHFQKVISIESKKRVQSKVDIYTDGTRKRHQDFGRISFVRLLNFKRFVFSKVKYGQSLSMRHYFSRLLLILFNQVTIFIVEHSNGE